MSDNEFQIIQRFFNRQVYQHYGVVLGIGDDAAILQVPAGQQLLVSMDTLVEGVHFRDTDAAMDIGYKSLAVNLSDMAAMGAIPAWITLSLAMPEADEDWLKKFSIGFFSLAHEHKVQLIGGDTTRGPLCITVQIHGFVPAKKALLRSGAKVGDHILVTGTLGDAALALELPDSARKEPENLPLFEALLRPVPRVQHGLALRGLANSAIDISDGLIADLEHVVNASGVSAHIETSQLPLSDALLRHHQAPQARQYALAGGDDYELCMTVPDQHLQEVLALNKKFDVGMTVIGNIREGSGVHCYTDDGQALTLKRKSFLHF